MAGVSFVGTTAGYVDDLSGTCGGSGAADHVYLLAISSPLASLTVTVTSTTGGYTPVVYLRSSCGTTSDVACAVGAGTTATLHMNTVAVGSYFLVVDGLSGTSGSYTVTLSAMSAAGDTCATVVPLTLVNGQATFSGSTTGYTNDVNSPTCFGTGPDRVFSFDVSTGSTATVSLAGGTGVTPVWQVRKGLSCASATELSCARATSSGGTATGTTVVLTPDTYYLWVDSQGASGDFALNLALNPVGATGDTCADPVPLVFVGDHASTTGTTTGLTADYSSSACGGSGEDKVYSFTLNTDSSIVATLSRQGSALQTVLYLRGSCTGADVRCGGGSGASSATINVPAISAGTYYLIVDGYGGSDGPFSLDVTAGPPQTSDGGVSDAGVSCSSLNCSGCCDASNVCQLGTANDACGTFGQACMRCQLLCLSGFCL